MIKDFRERIASLFSLTAVQKQAVFERERDVALMAGAGSGKTRTLVARYISLLAEGFSPQQVVAITFTKKAAAEMRSRIRETLNQLAQESDAEADQLRWTALSNEMDAARISTIHSLCAEILRAHPAEAGVDPKFIILDEGMTTILRTQSIEDAKVQLVAIPDFSPLFENFDIRFLTELLTTLLHKRYEAKEAFAQDSNDLEMVFRQIEMRLKDPSISDCMADLREMNADELLADAGDKLALQAREFLSVWAEAETALENKQLFSAAELFFRARREKMDGRIGKRDSQVKGIFRDLKSAYDTLLQPIFGGKNISDKAPDAQTEAQFQSIHQVLRSAFEIVLHYYESALRQRHAFDFDDLEVKAADLLEREDIRHRWQNEVAALLVDEFQDTNARQRTIVERLVCAPGDLFVVGDARQSIYRFRKADVTVFRAVQEKIRDRAGLILDLKQTYRAHEALLSAAGDLLSIVMGVEGFIIHRHGSRGG